MIIGIICNSARIWDTMIDRRPVLVLIVILTLIMLVPCISAEGTEDANVLVDPGNGDTFWVEGTGTTVLEQVSSAVSSRGMTASIVDGRLEIDGVSTVTIGSDGSGGSMSVAGSTGVHSISYWTLYGWTDSGWIVVEPSEPASSFTHYAVGLYPEGFRPVETPSHPVAWTMFRGDSGNTGAQDAEFGAKEDYSNLWYAKGAAFSNSLYVDGFIIQKFSTTTFGDDKGYATLSCLDLRTGEEAWSFKFLSGMNYESSTPLIVGDYVYVATMTGYIYKMPWATGPGIDYADVTSFSGCEMSKAVAAPSYIRDFGSGTTYDAGFTSLIYDSGGIYAAHSNGMLYCFDTDLNLIWSYMMDGGAYFIAPTVHDGILYAGALNGHMYILDAATGDLKIDQFIYSVEKRGRMYGGLGQIAVFDDGDVNTLVFTVSDGLGMSSTISGIAVYSFDPESNILVQRYLSDGLGTLGRYVSPVSGDSFRGAYAFAYEGGNGILYRISLDGTVEMALDGLKEIHSAGTVVNGKWLYGVSYSAPDPIYVIDLDTCTIAGTAKCAVEVRNFNMSSLLVIDDCIVGGTDSGIYVHEGRFMNYEPPSDKTGSPVILYLAGIVLIIALIIAAVWAIVRWRTGSDKPLKYLKDSFLHYLYGDNLLHNTRSRHRLKFVLLIGGILAFVSFTMCICIGSTSVLSPTEAYSALFSAISKGGNGLDTVETTVFVSRLPRTVAAIAVGIGLAIAGSIYQAIIRNPLVDPYIMGVSSGAGIAAIAVIAFDFTFFGIFSPHSVFLTAVSAMIGGLVAFACTMLIAEKAGGSSINYVLSGVVVGLAFSALQTIMLTMAGSKLSNALTWLYGSFAEVTWSQIGVVLFLSLFLSLVPMIWAKEFNLVLLGEDQAREMGLDVRRFNRCMLVLASVLTSVCVAFCGIIGFVGLVIPHLCRMILGSDHRMVLPASFVFGAIMLMLADLLSRTGYYGLELPVGAITTVIGIPVFAYLLVKKGRIYDG